MKYFCLGVATALLAVNALLFFAGILGDILYYAIIGIGFVVCLAMKFYDYCKDKTTTREGRDE